MIDIDSPVDQCVQSRKCCNLPKRCLVAVAPLLLMLGACGNSDATSSTDTVASTADEVPQLTFNGSDCVWVGPTELKAGVVSLEFINETDGLVGVFVGLLDEGKTIQNAVDDWGLDEPVVGGKPDWISDMGSQPPARAGETIRWEASLAAGHYVTNCTARIDGPTGYFGGGFTVVDG